MTDRSLELLVGDYIIAAGALPSLAFVLEYGLFRWIRRRKSDGLVLRYVPWWRSTVGALIFLIAFSLFATQAVVIASLFLGTEYPGREVYRIIGFSLSTISSYALLVVYALEGSKPSSVMLKADSA